ncbi:hypothetical protein AB0J28_29035 [Streptosporangium canum]|uniref:hypothetical protein n=1 Tax=Streptosporangium canum TaxID=324952 RepID=UPI00343F939D
MGNTARALASIVGPCWLAVIGATVSRSQWTTGGDLTHGSLPFGADPDYGRLLQILRASHSTTSWWRAQLDAHHDPLSRGVWALALLSIADGPVVHDCLAELDAVVCTPPPALATTLSSSA